MKLSKFDTVTNAEAGVDVTLIDISTGLESEAVIKVKGTDSAMFKQLNAERARMAIERRRARDGKDQTDEEIEEDSCALLAKLTVGWRGLENDNGEPLAFDYKAALSLYMSYPLIREQIDRAIADRSRFIKG